MQQFINWGANDPNKKEKERRLEEELWERAVNMKLHEARTSASAMDAAAAASAGNGDVSYTPFTDAWAYCMQGPNETSKLWMINLRTGERHLIGNTNKNYFTGIALDKTTQELFGVTHGSVGKKLWSINKSTGAATLIGNTTKIIPDITIGSDSVLRGWTEDGDDPITINKLTGEVTEVNSNLSSYQTGVANDTTAGNILVKTGSNLFRVNYTTGEYTQINSWDLGLKNAMDNWKSDLIAVNRDGGEGDPATWTKFYRLMKNGQYEYLSTVPFGVSGLAYASDTYTWNPGTSSTGWNTVTGGVAGDGTVVELGTGKFLITGPDDNANTGWVYIKKLFTEKTLVRVVYNWESMDENNLVDRPIWCTDSSEPTGAPSNNSNRAFTWPKENGLWEITVEAGDWLSIGIYSSDSCCGRGYLTAALYETVIPTTTTTSTTTIAPSTTTTTTHVPGLDFTVEWFQKSKGSFQAHPRIFSLGDFPAPNAVSIEGAGQHIYWWVQGTYRADAAITQVLDTWYHYAIVRKDGNLKIFQNGVQVGVDWSYPSAMPSGLNDLYIGAQVTQDSNFHGLITNFRWTNSAVYSGNFSVPTSPLTALANTKLLLLATDASNTVTDSSASPKSPVNHGTVAWDSDSPFAGGVGGSISLNGTTQYITVPASTDWDL